MNNCLACLQPLPKDNLHYHLGCLADFWQENNPVLQFDYALSELEDLAKENIAQRVVVPGVQPKLSLGFTGQKEKKRLTIVGALDGRYILKPPYQEYPQMPEIESLSMLLAHACGITTVPFLLIPLRDGQLAYLTRRIDRGALGKKFAMEDACQFTERLTEHKYRGSYEQIARAILKHNGNRLVDVVRFYEQVIVSYLIGNSDMHLKNFSLLSRMPDLYALAPAYDMLAVQLLLPDDKEDLALTLNGKKRKLKRLDFDTAMLRAGIPEKAVDNLWRRMKKGMGGWGDLIEKSFLHSDRKAALKDIVKLKSKELEIG